MDHDPGSIRMAAWQFGTSMMLVLGAFVVAATAFGQTAAIGRTWAIAEPDALSEIEARVTQQPKSVADRFGPREKWSAMQSAALGVARANRKRTVVPFHTLDFEIRLPDGKLLYPKGYTFNPLSYVSMPQRLVVVHPRDLDWAIGQARASDWILLAGGHAETVDPIAIGERVSRPLFILEERVRDRLNLSVAPVIVAQVGQRLEVTEFALERMDAATMNTPAHATNLR